jgi:hypothetical protein
MVLELGDNEQALVWLHRAYDEHSPILQFAKVPSFLDACAPIRVSSQFLKPGDALKTPAGEDLSEIEILQESTRRISFLREVIDVISAVGVDVSQGETVVAKQAPIRIDAV